MNRWYCTFCEKVSLDHDLLKTDHPFLKGETLAGCPHCREVEQMTAACWKCENKAVGGTIFPAGDYRFYCAQHGPKEE